MAVNLDDLNPQQREAVEHGNGPLLILAGAGSGKTRVLTYRIARLIEDGLAPWRILAITFTNKAAGELRERLAQLVGPGAEEIWASTFHSACVRMLRRDIERLGYKKGFTILDADDQKAVVKDCLKQLNISDKQFAPPAIAGAISQAKNAMLDVKEFTARAKDYWQGQVAKVYQLYQERLKSNNALDFDDLLLLSVRLLEQNPDVLEYYQNKFDQILVDEYQDTNSVQNRWVFLLAAKKRNLSVVGDDDQGIYSWRGADIRNILEFEQQYPDAHVIKLEQNYRSTGNILAGAYAVVCLNQGRKDKKLWTADGPGDKIIRYAATDEHDESWWVAAEIERLLAGTADGPRLTYQDIAILYRTHAQSRSLEEIFVRKSIPYGIYGGLKFFERKEVKDVLCYLRLIANPADTLSFRRAIGVPKRGIGPVSVDKVVDYADQWNLPVATAAVDCSLVQGLSGGYRAKVEQFAAFIEELTNQSVYLSVGELIDEVLTKSGYMDELKADNSLEAAARLENLTELKAMAMEFEMPTGAEAEGQSQLDAFLANAALMTDADAVEAGLNKVTMMTLHSAKGLEFPVVFLVGMEEGVFPHNRALADDTQMEEERRLCYVGMTRARLRLYLTSAMARSLYGQTEYHSPSRFLEEIPQELLEVAGGRRQGSAWGVGTASAYGGERAPAARTGGVGGWGSGSAQPTGDWGAARPSRTWANAEEESSPAIGSSGWGQTAEAKEMQRRARSAPWGEPASGPAAAAGPSLAEGDRVRHAKFGEGVVHGVRGDTITVHFPGVGQKQLVAGYLQRVEE
ncbi:MAG TPA: UvrD-helicase domain-containing protein [Symbiobacteriaceae bacterium]|jgi:DNA helicase-2/ATP-dependent DNA helicase PcrA